MELEMKYNSTLHLYWSEELEFTMIEMYIPGIPHE